VFGFLAGNLISDLGNSFSMLAIPWFVLATGGSASQTGIVVAAGVVPYIVVGILGGAFVDRLGPKRSAIISDLMSAAAVSAIPLLHSTVGIAFWQLIALVVLGAVFDGPGMSARMAMFPDLVHRAGINAERANTWFTLTRRIASVFGAPLAGVTIAAVGPSSLLWINAVSFIVSASMIATFVQIPAPEKVHKVVPEDIAIGTTYLQDLREGMHALLGNRLLVSMISAMLLGSLVAEPLYGLILPTYANQELGSAAQLGFIFGALGAGSIVGNLIYLAVKDRLSRSVFFIGGYVGRALCFTVFLASPTWWQIAIAIFLGAVSLEPGNPISMSVQQEQVPPGLRGRVFGVISAMAATMYPTGVVIYGFLISWIGMDRTLIVFVLLNLLFPIVLAIQPRLRHLPQAGEQASPSTAS
jgi:MFS family permease